VRVALCQLNPVVGDIDGNLGRLEATINRLSREPVDLAVFPELFLVGYPPRDLLSRTWFVERAGCALDRVRELSRRCPEAGLVVGSVVKSARARGKGLYNAAVLVDNGDLQLQAKTLLPTYDVFDEARYFDPADAIRPVEFRGTRLGLTVCEDAWNAPELWSQPSYDRDPVAELAAQGAELIVNIAASPFSVDKASVRHRLLSGHARRHRVGVLFANQVGGNDDLVFDGRSLAFDAAGRLQDAGPGFAESVRVIDTTSAGSDDEPRFPGRAEDVHGALVLGVRDYVHKCGFRDVIIGLSGGIDSAVVAAIAAAALGQENVTGVTMPSEFSSPGSVTDSRELAANLGIRFCELPIGPVYRQYLQTLGPLFAGREPDETEENIQARVRGNLLMALSNKRGSLVLTTGNKSELAVGYCTLYGDMSGGLCVLADVPKTLVYELARFINRDRRLIPESTLTKPPSAELRPNQTDQDTLPPYDVLDAIIERYVDEGRSPEEILAAGFEPAAVDWVVRAINRNEYKRRQAATGLKVTSRAFGSGWRMPIAARY
jgi:NAD+ synthase (glutamine-hydrolysing)